MPDCPTYEALTAEIARAEAADEDWVAISMSHPDGQRIIYALLTPREAYGRLGVQRRLAKDRTPGTCELCGQPFVGLRGRRFCGPTCLKKAARLRREERQRVERGEPETVAT